MIKIVISYFLENQNLVYIRYIIQSSLNGLNDKIERKNYVNNKYYIRILELSMEFKRINNSISNYAFF